MPEEDAFDETLLLRSTSAAVALGLVGKTAELTGDRPRASPKDDWDAARRRLIARDFQLPVPVTRCLLASASAVSMSGRTGRVRARPLLERLSAVDQRWSVDSSR